MERARPVLPTELLCLVIHQADHDTLKRLRQCCKWLAKEAACQLFDTVHVVLQKDGMERVARIAGHDTLSSAVRTLVIRKRIRLPECNYEWWRSDIELPVDDKNDSEHMQQLFNQYESDRTEPSIYECLSRGRLPRDWRQLARNPARSNPNVELDPYWTRLQHIYEDFEDALLKFNNLQNVVADWPDDSGDTPIWRGYTFTHLQHASFYGLPADEAPSDEAAQMAFLLRALGWRASFSSSLTSLYLDLSGDKWWGPQHFQAVWARNAASNRAPPGTLAAHARLTDAAFTHLTSLHLHVSVSRASLAAATAAVARLLSAAGNLTRLDLALPTVYPGSVTALADLDILALISRAVRWPRIRHVAFASTLTGPSLVAALTRVAASIRSLRLLDCTLLGEGDSWSRVYRALRHVPFAELAALDFRDCIDGDADEEGEALPDPLEEGYRRLHFTSLMQVRPAVGHFSLVQGLLVRKGYSADLYEWILGRREVMPVLYRYSM